MLAMRVDRDIANHDQLVIILGTVFKSFQKFNRVNTVTTHPMPPRLRKTKRRFLDAFPCGVFAGGIFKKPFDHILDRKAVVKGHLRHFPPV